jgi:hypothetical protein
MTIELGILIAVISCVLAVAGFFSGKMTAAKKDTHEKAVTMTELKKDIEALTNAVTNEIKAITNHFDKDIGYLQKDMSGILSAIERIEKNTSDSIRRLHLRLDEHEQKFHIERA